MTGTWVLLTLLVFSVLDVLVLAYLYRTRSTGTETGAETVHGDTVECPECGASNDRGYRFCRRCVSDLPGGMSVLDGSSPPEGRQTL